MGLVSTPVMFARVQMAVVLGVVVVAGAVVVVVVALAVPLTVAPAQLALKSPAAPASRYQLY